MKILVHGALGRMGKEVIALAEAGARDSLLAGKVDLGGDGEDILRSLTDFTGDADVIVDFSHHTATSALLSYAISRKLPVVVATTGHTEEELALLRTAGMQIPIFHSANMSVGISLLCELAKQAASALPDADIEIVEVHHNRKLDAPSGTALMLADALKTVRTDADFVMGRSGQGKRQANEIGIHAVRMGNIIGQHEVLISTDSQTVTLKHEAHSRALFAEGAIAAAAFLVRQEPGLYDMRSLLSEGR